MLRLPSMKQVLLSCSIVCLFALCPLGSPLAAQNTNSTGEATSPSTDTVGNSVVAPLPKPDIAREGSGNSMTTPPDTISDDVYSDMFKILFAVFVLAVVIESALALIFNWRPFLMRFDGRGVRSLVAFAVSWSVARSLGLDIVERLSEATNSAADAATSQLGFLLTGLILAGGSSGVNNLFRSLGIRQISRKDEILPKPARNEAWIAVRLRRVNARGPVNVLLQRVGQNPRLIGSITGIGSPHPLFAWALTDKSRFPAVAGFQVRGGEYVSLLLEGRDETGAAVTASWGPYTVETGAIIDFELKL